MYCELEVGVHGTRDYGGLISVSFSGGDWWVSASWFYEWVMIFYLSFRTDSNLVIWNSQIFR